MTEGRISESSLFTMAPLIEAFRAESALGTREPLRDVALVCVQHLLETTGTLIESFLKLGLQPQNIFVAGKVYSTNPSVEHRIRRLGIYLQTAGVPKRWGYYEQQLRTDVAQLWDVAARHIARHRIGKIIVLDDGGCALSSIPEALLYQRHVVGVEQTMSGLTLQAAGRVLVPVVEVAASAAKRLIEPFLIQKTIFQRLLNSPGEGLKGERCGIVGYGNIGRAVAYALLTLKKEILVFDPSDEASNAATAKNVPATGDLKNLVTRCDLVFGCAGQDIFAKDNCLRDLRGNKTFVSCSSLDLEFRTLLRSLGEIPEPAYQTMLEDVDLGEEKTLLRGGFPINFDRSPESVPLDEIQLTRALLLGGVLQAASLRDDGCPRFSDIPLLAEHQQFIVSRWFSFDENRRAWYALETLKIFDSLETIERYSRVGDQLAFPAALA